MSSMIDRMHSVTVSRGVGRAIISVNFKREHVIPNTQAARHKGKYVCARQSVLDGHVEF